MFRLSEQSLNFELILLNTNIHAFVDQTILIPLNLELQGFGESLRETTDDLLDFLGQAAVNLNICLNAGSLQAGLVQGSAFCGAVLYDNEHKPQRALISPEELTVTMTIKLLEEAPDE